MLELAADVAGRGENKTVLERVTLIRVGLCPPSVYPPDYTKSPLTGEARIWSSTKGRSQGLRSVSSHEPSLAKPSIVSGSPFDIPPLIPLPFTYC